MISRRTVLTAAVVGTGAGAVGWGVVGRGAADGGLQALGLRPHAEPDPRETALLTEAARDQVELIAAIDRVEEDERTELAAIREVLSEQLAAVSPNPPPPAGTSPSTTDLDAMADRIEAVAAARADGAMAAHSLAVIKVLAAMSAGLDQVAIAVRRLA